VPRRDARVDRDREPGARYLIFPHSCVSLKDLGCVLLLRSGYGVLGVGVLGMNTTVDATIQFTPSSCNNSE